MRTFEGEGTGKSGGEPEAKIIRANGQVLGVKPANGRSFSLDEMQTIVGGYVEVIYPESRTGAIMVVNEEGKLIGLPRNLMATRIWQDQADPGSQRMADHVCGDVLLCHRTQID